MPTNLSRARRLTTYSFLVLAILFLLPSSRLWGDDQIAGVASVKICNNGSISVDVATARDISDGGRWDVERWRSVEPGECNVVLKWYMEPITGLTYKFAKSHPVHIAFAFTDATGVWGASKFKLTKSFFPGWSEARFGGTDDYDSLQQSDRQLCVDRGIKEYAMNGADPGAGCKDEGPGMFLIPASIDWEMKTDTTLILDVTFGPNDRAIPLGPNSVSSASPSPSNGSNNNSDVSILKVVGGLLNAARVADMKNVDAFYGVLKDSMRGPGAPPLTRTACTASRLCDDLEFCASRSFVGAHPWDSAANATVVRNAIRAYVGTHTLGNYLPVHESDQTNGTVFVEVAETSDHHVTAEESSQCVDGGFTYDIYSVPLGPEPSKVGTPVVSPAPPPAPPADDPMEGDGGFISPPKAFASELKVDVCVPPDLVDKLSWDNPAPDSEMAAFKTFLKNFIRNYADGQTLYRITDDAFDRFDRGRRAATPYAPDPSIVFKAVSAGQPCPATNYVYTVAVPAQR
jgi:Protein of unknown function (DUF1036)